MCTSPATAIVRLVEDSLSIALLEGRVHAGDRVKAQIANEDGNDGNGNKKIIYYTK